jgi:hypothetical protein
VRMVRFASFQIPKFYTARVDLTEQEYDLFKRILIKIPTLISQAKEEPTPPPLKA